MAGSVGLVSAAEAVPGCRRPFPGADETSPWSAGSIAEVGKDPLALENLLALESLDQLQSRQSQTKRRDPVPQCPGPRASVLAIRSQRLSCS